ncbi:MAG: ABC transporter substrate-binding protein [Xanthobacteraceae bacterium]
MRRREFIALIGGMATAWPGTMRAQPREQMRRVGILMGGASAVSSESQASMAAFVQELQKFGWTEGRNLRIDSLWAVGNPDNVLEYAAELATLAPVLAAFAPDVILTNGTGTMAPMLQATRTVPIVFVNVTDPVGAGFVESLVRPGRSATGFTNFQYSVASKWLELLKEISPGVTRVAVLRDPAIAAGVGQWAAIKAAAPSLKVEVISGDLGEAAEIERAFAAFDSPADKASTRGLIVTTSAIATVHRRLIIELAARHKLPAVYSRKLFVTEGGLISYGTDLIDQFRLAAGYVDRILRGEKPSDLPVQAPSKYELVVNLNTAKALGLEIPAPVLARADEVIG